MKPFARFGLVITLLAFVLSGCIPLRTINDKLSGGSTKLGPSWPVSVSIPMLKGKELDVQGLDGLEGATWSTELVSVNEQLGDRSVDVSIDHVVDVVNPDPLNPLAQIVAFPVNDFRTDVELDDIVEAKLDGASGYIEIIFDGVKVPDGESVFIYLRNAADDSVVTQVEISSEDDGGELQLAGITLVPQMYLDATGQLQFAGPADGQIVVQTIGTFMLAEVELQPGQLASRFDAVDVQESERFSLGEDLQLDTLELNFAADVDFVGFTAENLQIVLRTNLTGYDRHGGIVRTVNVDSILSPDVDSLDDLADEVVALLTDPLVKEVEMNIDGVEVEPVDPAENSKITFTDDPSVYAELSLAIGGPDADVAVGFSSTFETPDDMPEQVEGGVIALTIKNDSPVNGRLDIWITKKNPATLPNNPDIRLPLQAGSPKEIVEITIGSDLLDLLRTSDEAQITVQLSGISTTRPVQPGDVILIDAQAKIAGRVNR